METKSFEAATYALSRGLKEIFQKLSPTVKSNAEEIRLRTGLPLALTVSGDTVFVTKDGRTSFSYRDDLACASGEDMAECFKLLCGGSVYAHGEELRNGFIMMKKGCREGVCGTLSDSGNMRDITSINIRIAREVLGAANSIVRANLSGGLLIAGAPGSGKTTVLRDLVRQISNGAAGRMKRIAVIDSRGEISGGFGGSRKNDLGLNTDVLMTYDKAAGIETAIRTMFPEVVAFDEIGSDSELESVRQSFHSGVQIITTAHIGSASELTQRSVTAKLIKSGAISNIALLPILHSSNIKLISAKELFRVTAV